MKVLTVVGNRPQFVKAAAVSRHLGREGIDEVLVHTGQHYDRELSDVFFEELGLAPPDVELGVGSGSHAVQTAESMVRLEKTVEMETPDAALVYGDTNATLSGALVAAKLGVPIAHVEAGMRSFDRSMPEEINRMAVDRLADLLLCSTEAAVKNLQEAGLGGRARLIGDVMADVVFEFGPLADRHSRALERFGLQEGGYLLATAHRAGNVDIRVSLVRILRILEEAAARSGPLVFPLHPRTRARLGEFELLRRLQQNPDIILCDPLGYLDFARLLRGARAVITDSGGLQKESYLAGVPCLTLRERTEWVETVDSGWNHLVGLDRERASRALQGIAADRPPPPDETLYGTGNAGRRCADELARWNEVRW